ncbi:MAG: endolytic transglycosylase MltG [Oscillospiraceae bacterium]|nr:endolytic transglycosylase MltG [Oscillospiraceae bacterium]
MSDERQYHTARYDTQRVREEDARRRAAAQGGGRRQLTPAQKEKLRRKGRIRRFFLRTLLWVIFVIVASLALSGVGWLLANDFAAFNKEPVTATVTVTKDDDLDTVADKLKDEGLIEYKWFFKLFGKVAHAEDKIGIGAHELNTTMDYSALINGMRSSSGSLTSETVRVTFKEGLTVRQTIALMAEYGVNTEEELTDAAKNYDFDYAFITGGKGDITRLEGYLFPDTYEFYVGGNPATALGRMLSNFEAKLSDETLEEAIENSPYTLSQVVTIASLIEKETDGHDRANIASVIYNRLSNAGETAYLLQIDASQIYGLGDRYTGQLTRSDLEIDTPYNTHIHQGLPPTPIANPGIASIQAALEPAQTGFYFYALGTDGAHHFFATYNEFLSFVNSSSYGG